MLFGGVIMSSKTRFISQVYRVDGSNPPQFGFCRVMVEENVYTILFRSQDLKSSLEEAQAEAARSSSQLDYMCDLEDRYGATIGHP